MRIRCIRQAKVTDIFWVVLRLLQGAQQDRFQQALVGAALNLFNKLGVIRRFGFIASGQVQTKFSQEITHHGKALWGRHGMNTIQASMLMAGQIIRSTDVGRQHAFFN